MSEQLAEELELVRRLVLDAGDMLLDSLDTVGTIRSKRATELVTDLDSQVEEYLLGSLGRHFPADSFLAEESGDTAGSNGRTWYIDPLDGTTNYAHGFPFFSVSVACADAEKLLLGAVYAPYLDELYLAVDQGGATLTRPEHGVSRSLARRSAVELTSALLSTGFPYVRDETVDRNTGHVADFLKASCHGVRRGGSAAIDLVHVAAGKLDGYWEYNLRPWDAAAGTLIAREAGAIVSGLDGKSGRLHFENILAAAPGLHQQMMQVLARRREGATS
jgi:myo-inositol-1(or 4)-monophosphatase